MMERLRLESNSELHFILSIDRCLWLCLLRGTSVTTKDLELDYKITNILSELAADNSKTLTQSSS